MCRLIAAKMEISIQKYRTNTKRSEAHITTTTILIKRENKTEMKIMSNKKKENKKNINFV